MEERNVTGSMEQEHIYKYTPGGNHFNDGG